MAGYTSNSLIESVKVRAAVPIAQNTFGPEDLLRFANEEIDLELIPLILSVKEEFFVYSQDITINAGDTSFPIPYRAIGSKVRTLHYVDPSGNLFPLTRVQPEQISEFEGGSFINRINAFYIQGNDIMLIPSIREGDGTGTIRCTYYMRPNDLVAESRIGIISNVDLINGTVTVENYPSVIKVNSKVDFVQGISGNKLKGFDLLVTATNPSISSKTITVGPGNLPTSLVVGDMIALAGECSVPQIPTDLHVVLAQSVACRVLESIGDTQGLTNANAKLEKMVQKTLLLIDSRVEGSPQKILNTNSQLWRGRNSFRRIGRL